MQRGVDAAAGRGGGQRDGAPAGDLLDEIVGAVQRGALAALQRRDVVADAVPPGLLDQLRPVDAGRQRRCPLAGAHALQRPAVVVGPRPSVLRGEAAPALAPEVLAVDDHAVHVEDDPAHRRDSTEEDAMT